MQRFAAEPRWDDAASESTALPQLETGASSVREGDGPRYELCFDSLIGGCVYTFPCDSAGRVDLDALSDTARLDYLYARRVIGRVFRVPAVRPH
jgi:hypothetical protein